MKFIIVELFSLSALQKSNVSLVTTQQTGSLQLVNTGESIQPEAISFCDKFQGGVKKEPELMTYKYKLTINLHPLTLSLDEDS